MVAYFETKPIGVGPGWFRWAVTVRGRRAIVDCANCANCARDTTLPASIGLFFETNPILGPAFGVAAVDLICWCRRIIVFSRSMGGRGDDRYRAQSPARPFIPFVAGD